MGASEQGLRHHRETAADSSETANFRKAAKFNCVFASAFDLENRMRNFLVRNVSFVSGVEQNEGIVLAGVLNPSHPLITSRDRASRIVWKAQINKIDMFPAAAGRLGDKIVFRPARQINYAPVTSLLSRKSGATRHYLSVHVNRINK